VSNAVGGPAHLDPSRVLVHSLSPGSVIAKVRFSLPLPPTSSSSSPLHTKVRILSALPSSGSPAPEEGDAYIGDASLPMGAAKVVASIRQQLTDPDDSRGAAGGSSGGDGGSGSIFNGQLTCLVDVARTVDACARLEESEAEWATEMLAAVYHAHVKRSL
jgi:hypothetical protein